MRLGEFWQRMTAHFGRAYVDSVARDHVMSQLGGRTIAEAIEDGMDPKAVWRVVCECFDVPDSLT